MPGSRGEAAKIEEGAQLSVGEKQGRSGVRLELIL